MRLLSKPEIQRELAADRKLSIDEGISLARKVDGLRQKAAAEEASLDTFRTGTVQATLEEISSLAQQKQDLIGELAFLKKKREEALAPIDASWEALVAGEQSLSAKELDYTDRYENLTTRERELVSSKEEHLFEMQRTADEKKRSSELLVEADNFNQAARQTKNQADYETGVVTAAIALRENAVSAREASVDMTEDRQVKRDAFQDERERFLNEEERRVKDLYQTFTRTKERIDGKR